MGISDDGLPKTYAELLRQFREAAGFTQAELAKAAGVSERSVSNHERGANRTARNETARLLADALGLTGWQREAFLASARGRVTVAEAGAGRIAATRTLPRDVGSFTGRENDLHKLVGPVTSAARTDAVMGIYVIGGMAGIGKTTFAVHAAHLLAPQFPDGQIFLPLHGHTPGLRPADPANALAILLQAIGIPPTQIPPTLEERTGLWRDRAAGKQLLLVLDDAANSEQVRPLLPSAARSLVLVTSRRHLSALDDTRAISLYTLARSEAATLFVRLAARPELAIDDVAIAEIARLCDYLPLAVALLARQLHHHEAWTAASLAGELSGAHDRLELIVTENLSVAAAFDLSYKDLTEPQRRLFRRLGLHPGPNVDACAAAALDGTGARDARTRLAALYDQYLLTEPAPGRYRLHDLMREYARILAAREDSAAEREQATQRLLDYYQHAAEAADQLLSHYTRPGRPAVAALDPVSRSRDMAQALSWAQTERANLLACLDRANEAGDHARVVALTAAIAAVLRRDGPWAEAISRHMIAAAAARHIGDRLAEANAVNDLGDLRYMTGDSQGAAGDLQTALATYRDIGDRQGEANALALLANTRLGTGDYPGAADALDVALSIYRDLGDQRGLASALKLLGSLRYLTAQFREAAEAMQTALGIYRELGDRQGQAAILSNIGNVRQLTGEYGAAAEALQTALRICRDLRDREGQANVLNNLGSVRRRTGEYEAAAEALQTALAIYRDFGDRQGEANALNFLGAVRRMTEDYPGAADALEVALEIYRDLGDKGGEAEALNQAGELHRARGELDQAMECHTRALNLAGEIQSPWDKAHALAGLGRCAAAGGRIAEARTALRQAQEIFQEIGAAGEAAEIAAELDNLEG